jgi:hypothetical protein
MDFEDVQVKAFCKNCSGELVLVHGEYNGKKVSVWIHDPAFKPVRGAKICVHPER